MHAVTSRAELRLTPMAEVLLFLACLDACCRHSG